MDARTLYETTDVALVTELRPSLSDEILFLVEAVSDEAGFDL
jgi:hypothetical protein